ncbi:MAG: HAMP domain-containing histidine kinase [Desulfarculaceae bacterium]|nr:HAMP domain-containing histidine kinase [Desulfarculaceae bacterium]MCF8072146.1 HAMP domain-containing histidine kinase [Desulfarculaceae bacterium]MCF8100067.1 HAMP domain-containing histidine kinase [Desulfarculaceae bacterium]MCF8118274.1 HAMP domain-containing histidine kinase [Desulfarculaceae bacterium]
MAEGPARPGGAPPPPGDELSEEAAAIEGRLGLARDAEQARRALLARPRFSLRLQIFLGNAIAFLVAVAVAVALIASSHRMESKTRFLEIVNDYVMQVEQARRFEKNFFLYGTNLSDAQDNVFQAEAILNRNAEELAAIMGADWRRQVLPNLHSYARLLEKLGQGAHRDQPVGKAERLKLQSQVRAQGQQMVSAALAVLSKEKAALSEVIARSRQLLFYSMGLLLVFMVFNAYWLGSRMLSSIGRFGQYAGRIASGDFTPVTPTRRYRDEFTELALAINSMIEELEKREAVLVQSHKMRAVGTLTAGVAHELNNPMNNITLTAHMLQEDYADLDDPERREMIDDVVAEASRAKKIISNLLDFARESGSQLEPLDLPHLLQETIALAGNQIKLSGIKIDFQSSGNLPRVHGDSQQLQQVFLNLILNAIDASHKRGSIHVLVLPADEPNYLAVKVMDEGTGIPAHILGSIFDPFFTTKEKGKGTGLGLSVSQGIVAKHGGRIMVSSQEDKGTTFTVVLPVTTIPAQLGSEKA